MIVLGLDPGIARTGFGVITTDETHPFIACGCITTPAHDQAVERLKAIGEDLERLISRHKPTQAVVETVFFGNNSKTAMLTAETRGVLVYILGQHNIPIMSLTPLQIKSRLTGYGAATKKQMQAVITQRLQLTTAPEPDDAADALAAALSLADQPIAYSRRVASV